MHDFKLSAEADQALHAMEDTREHIFLTGRAGTGKSTLLQHFRMTTGKNIVVLAPTGVAAVNVQGQTIHSFFGFKPGMTAAAVRRWSDRKTKTFKKLDAIVIDEVSMVRADLLDCVDSFLRLNGPSELLPFGGIQMIFIGDLYQLPPVVPYHEKALFTSYYPGAYFFDARVFQGLPLSYHELAIVYRQKDTDFIRVLDAIRTAQVTNDQLELINARHDPHFEEVDDFYIYLMSTNAMADELNQYKLERIDTASRVFQSTLNGEFPRGSLPTAEELTLKENAQVMLLNNESTGRWVNGDIGKIIKIEGAEGHQAIIKVKLANGTIEDVLPHTWNMAKYYYNEMTRKVESQTLGSFTQYPLRLAWAVTIHKGQGKTFDKVVIDFGHGTFAHGQAYVALSRCTSLEGLVLLTPVQQRHIFIDPRVTTFLNNKTIQPRALDHPF